VKRTISKKRDSKENPFDLNADVQQKYVFIFVHVSHTPASTKTQSESYQFCNKFHGTEEAYSNLNPGITT